MSDRLIQAAVHNRWHPAIEPVLTVSPGETVTFVTADGAAGQVTRASVSMGRGDLNLDLLHPLSGPVFVEGCGPGDVVEIEILDIHPADFGWTSVYPMAGGLLSHLVDRTFTVGWEIRDGSATSELMPGMQIPGNPSIGVIGVAPSLERLREMTEAEASLAARYPGILLPSAMGALPDSASAGAGLRTLPARRIGGNLDIRQIGVGSRVLLTSDVEGALLSMGDVHFRQGDGECFGTGIEIESTVVARIGVREKLAWQPTAPVVIHPGSRIDDGDVIATTGLGSYQDLGAALADAAAAMIDHLILDKGLTREQAQIAINVAASISVSAVNNPPAAVVTLGIPLGIFV